MVNVSNRKVGVQASARNGMRGCAITVLLSYLVNVGDLLAEVEFGRLGVLYTLDVNKSSLVVCVLLAPANIEQSNQPILPTITHQ
jgi:hypothetical protein